MCCKKKKRKQMRSICEDMYSICTFLSVFLFFLRVYYDHDDDDELLEVTISSSMTGLTNVVDNSASLLGK